MSLQPLDRRLRKQLENTIVNARVKSEIAAKVALERLCVGDIKPGEHLTEEMRQQRNRLRAHGRQLGDIRQENAEQSLTNLIQETAYEHWHRMLFARFLAENNLLMYEDGATPLSIQDCVDLALEEKGVNGWELAGHFASAMLPQIFKSENPALTVKFSPEHQRELEQLLEGLDKETFQASDSLGWVYQYWQTQRKDEVNRSGNKIGADELSAVTQLFTEPYMVSFLLDNSLGAWWVSNYPEHKDLLPFQYLRYAPEQTDQADAEYKETTIPAAGTFEQWPKNLSELKMLDPCCGSGHFLVATLLMLVPMRMKAEGLSADEAIARALSENIHGLELDQRCVEIAAFAVALEAWRYPESSGYRSLPSLNIAWVGQSIKATKTDWLALAGTDDNLSLGMEALYNTFKDAPLLGSLIDPGKSIANDLLSDGFANLQPLLNQALQQFEVAEDQEAAIAAKGLTLAVDLLNQKYELIATNVPYLSRGKQCQALQDFTERHYGNAKGDIANVFLERCLELNSKSGVTQMVMPQNWLFLGSYKKQREHLLKEVTWNLLARLGAGAFDAISGEVVKAILISLSRCDDLLRYALPKNFIRGLDVSELSSTTDKANGLIGAQIKSFEQANQLNNPDAVVVLDEIVNSILLNQFSYSHHGLTSGDLPRMKIFYWEINKKLDEWILFQSTHKATCFYGGVDSYLRWNNGQGAINELKGARKDGTLAWGKKGITLSQMGELPATLYLGQAFDNNTAVLVPNNESNLLSIWSFCASHKYSQEVKKIDQSMAVTSATMAKVPFDHSYWSNVAKANYPNGLPEPFSDDPTQWIFHGHPCGSVVWDEETKCTNYGLHRTDDTVLQVAVARLLGYQWPAESDKDMGLSVEARAWIAQCESLASFVDDDGIVCLSPVRGEKAADERLEALLMAAFGEQWNASLRNKLLTDVQCSGKTLGFWLREKFFEQHCKLFQNRPFIWHIWDGLADGFNALVNYHQLDRQNLERLIYTYLGDWIRTQDHGVKEGIDGAVLRLQAAQILKTRLETILEGEAPYDIFVRWKPLSEQPLGWNPDINDGVRLNIRPFMTVPDVGKKGAGILRSKPNIKWTKDRGNDVASAPWYTLGLQYGESAGSRINDHHLKLAEKKAARDV